MHQNNNQRDMVRTARIAGVWYLILGLAGVLGFMVFHPQIYITNDPAKTFKNLTEHELIARARLLLEFTIIISQALTAVWFYKLFRSINAWAAWALAVWGMMNAAAIMVSAVSMGTVLGVTYSTVPSVDDKLVLIQLLDQLSTNAWGVGGIFFGLWLIPMGHIVVSSGRMPVWLGRILIIGGVGYLLNTFIHYAGLTSPLIDMLVIPATIGEFWMIGYLMTYGIRESNEQN